MAQNHDRGTSTPRTTSPELSSGEADLFRDAFNAAGFAMLVTGPNLDARGPTISFANRAMTAITGYEVGELIGQSPRILRGPGSDRSEIRRRNRKLLRDGTYTGEVLNYRKDGSSYVARWTITAIPGRDGGVRGWLAIQADKPAMQVTLDVVAAVQARHSILLESIPHLVWQSRDGGDWCAAGPQWQDFTGQSEKASCGVGWRETIEPRDHAKTDEAWQQAIDTGVLAVAHRIRRYDGTYRWFQTRALPVPVNALPGRDRIWIGTSTDVHDLRVAEARIRDLAFRDALTDLGNRGMLQDVLRRMTHGAPGVQPFNVLFLDVDAFKQVNDKFGHRGGDEVLREIARRLLGQVRDSDVVVRIGGDEFVLVQADAGPEDGSRLADRIRDRMAEWFTIDGEQLRVSACIGIASCPIDGLDADRLLRRADLALYNAKTKGGGDLRFFEPPMEFARQERLAIQTALAHAVERDELAVAYQAICDAETGTVRGYEALARWTHPERGAVPPVAFIPVAEETGLIVSVGQWILERACRDATDQAFGARTVAVNLSPAQFQSGSLARMVTDILDRTGLAPERLELEVTERLVMDSGEVVDRTLRDIEAAGVRIALDDFGTGYSNLGNLCRFPFDLLKIDQSFVRQMTEDAGVRAVVGRFIALAHSLRLQVTAEGVETEEQLAILRTLRCDQVQGFLLGRPVPFSRLGTL